MKVSQPIVLIEDSPEDYEITIRGFKQSRLSNPIIWFDNGDDALDYFFQKGAYENQERPPLPGIILLDLNLPGTDGLEILETLKKDPELSQIPVVVLTTSDDPRDIHQCYSKGANSFIKKPVNVTDFIKAIERLNDYWFEIVILPERRS